MHDLNRNLIRQFAFASVLACLVSGCGDSNRAKIIGTWGIDQADTVMSRFDRSGAEMNDRAADSESADPPGMLLFFRGNGQLETSTSMGVVKQDKKGNWKMVSFDPVADSMTISCEIQTQESETVIEFIDQDTIRLVPPNMAGTTMKLIFKRR